MTEKLTDFSVVKGELYGWVVIDRNGQTADGGKLPAAHFSTFEDLLCWLGKNAADDDDDFRTIGDDDLKPGSVRFAPGLR